MASLTASVTASLAAPLTIFIKSHVHPFFMETILIDRHVENRLQEMTDIEKNIKKLFGYDLFIQCDLESHIVVYEIASLGIIFSCEFESK